MKDTLIKALGLEQASTEIQDQAIESMGALVYQSVITRAMEEMDENLLDEFEKITNSDPTPEILINFFLQNIPNFESMMKEEASRIMEDSANMMGKTNEN